MSGTLGSQPPRNSAKCIAGNACYLQSIDLVFGPHWVCKLELSNQSSSETPNHGRTLTSKGAFENFWGNPSGSTAQRTGAQGNGAPQRRVMGEEIKKAPFVAVMVDETSDVSNAAQLTLVLRYVTDASVKERFVRFEDVTSGKRADDIAALIVSFLEECECLDKVVAQCFDGQCYAPVMSYGLNGVQAKVSPKRTQLLDEIGQRRLPRVARTRWQYTSRLASRVFEKRVALKELFHHMNVMRSMTRTLC
ncbi:unnamed protein product [Leuciscus chuanchicus]